mgnify:CR=1 FL=1
MGSLTGKKILFVITKSNWGGAQQYVYTLATHFKEAGADVVVALGGTGAAGAPTGLLETRLTEVGVRTIFLTSFARDVSPLREGVAFFELLRVLRAEKPDVLHLNSSKAGGIGTLAGRIAHVPRILFTAHGWAHREARNPFSRLLIWIASWVTIIFSHTVIVVSERDYQSAPVLFSRKKIRVVHNGIPRNLSLPTREQAQERLQTIVPALPKGMPIILSIGELTRNKAHEVLIAALAQVRFPFFCIIIGEGEERPNLERSIAAHNLADRVLLAGFVPNAAELLPAADIFVLPSRKEGLPFTLLEAGIAALPVITTNTGGIPEIIFADQSMGILIPTDDAESLATNLEKLLKDPVLREQLGKTLREHVLKDFSEQAMLRRTETAYLPTDKAGN